MSIASLLYQIFPNPQYNAILVTVLIDGREYT